ncbi:MAG TPA: hypothetical protein VMO20_00115 [Candidatus Acidoferrum sp.]|nr:hypothetical protein [Candidatus Acidoferrum sp.]
MKYAVKMILAVIVLLWIVIFAAGRMGRRIQLDHDWSAPVAVAATQNAEAGGGDLYKWHDTLMLMDEQQDWLPHSVICSSSTFSIKIRKNDPSNSWTQLTPEQFQGFYALYAPALDPANDKIMLGGGYIESNDLHMSTVFLRMDGDDKIQVETEKTWVNDQESLLGKTGTNVTLNEPAIRGLPSNRAYPTLGKGILEGPEIYIPYSLRTTTFVPPNNLSDSPFANGVFHSTNSGATWQLERISDFDGVESEMCETKDYDYLLELGQWKILSVRKPIGGSSWEKPTILTETFSSQRGGGATAEGDTVHFCWLDRRHEKWRFNYAFPYLGNYEVFYRQRKDTDPTWSKDANLSKGVLFSYWPGMSVEGKNVVVVWDGGESKPSYDVYYATSKDGGKTWARPLKITDRAKDGFTSEHPQVALQNGIIHLLYAQGKRDPEVQAREQGSWPIYYQQRPFPE